MKHTKMSRKELRRTLVFLVGFVAVFSLFCVPMGLANALHTMINTAYALLMDTVFYIMAIAVLAGAVSALFSRFGVVRLLDRLLSPLMRPLYGLPGAAALGIVTTYLSDNPAILTLAEDREYRSCFRAYQIPALTNLGTSFGMGLIVTTFVLGLGSEYRTGLAALCGNLGAVIGSIVSTRLMLAHTGKVLGKEAPARLPASDTADSGAEQETPVGQQLMEALMTGGKSGAELGLGIIPGVLIVCTLVMMLTNGAPADGVYTGGAFEGVGLLPLLADKLSFLLRPLFGFSSGAAISVPMTALGSAGAALGLIPALLEQGKADSGDLAVFMAMCMCWSGYLSTHVSMMDVLESRSFTGRAILSHTLGGLCAGVAANWLFRLLGG